MTAGGAITFAADGAERFPAALDEAACRAVELALACLPTGVPGVRIAVAPALRDLLGPNGAAGSIATGVSST